MYLAGAMATSIRTNTDDVVQALMNPKHPKISILVRVIAAITCMALLAGCATTPQAARGPLYSPAADMMREARSAQTPVEKRAANYLQVAAMTAPLLSTGAQETPARDTYNAAAAELTLLLRSADGGRLWDRPLTFTAENTTYHLRLQPGRYPSTWSPDFFTSFETPYQIKRSLVKKEVTQDGVGGALVGVRLVNPPEQFAPRKGMSAAVTATLDFHGSDAVLALRRPSSDPVARVEGKVRPLAADFSAPISYFRPPNNLLLFGMMGTLSGANMMEKTGLYFLEPYDPSRIPIVFVHGLASTPFTWVKTINGLQQDPEIRKRYQPWVFGYATGNPILYSALRLREELAKVDKLYPNHLPYVLVGHSMGGMLTHAQVTTVTREMWEKDKNVGPAMQSIFANNSTDSLVVRALTYRANPRIKRVVFVCTPHRGSNMASGGLGSLAVSLISLPAKVLTPIKDSITSAELVQLTGSSKRLPNSVWGLKPTNPAFSVVNEPRISIPYHSIIGDRGKGDCPTCTDGVVAYWSSHLEGARSECIVPGPHGSAELPQTIAELDRILRLHLGLRSPSTKIVAQSGL
jgi:pimeloyl-ACP methyl ester carboxylesterase